MSGSTLSIPLSRPDIGELERRYVMDTLSGHRLSLGPMVRRFEAAFADYMGARHAIAVSSGTAGLHLCVRALGLGEGDEVITTPFSFVASANCLLYERIKPVFVDIDRQTMNLDWKLIEDRVTPRTKAILPVHVFGYPCEMTPILEIARRHNLAVLEDACEAVGAEMDGRKAGAFGQCAVFAFYPNKQMTTGEGGIITTNDDAIARLVRSMRNQGRGDDGGWLSHERLGYNYRLSDIQCALGLAQLERIGELLAKRERAAGYYEKHLRAVGGIALPFSGPRRKRSWFVYVVVLNEGFSRDRRDSILRGLAARGIGCSNYFQPIHLQPFYASQFGFRQGNYPVTEEISDRTIALPFYGDLSEEQVDYIAENLEKEMSLNRANGENGIMSANVNPLMP